MASKSDRIAVTILSVCDGALRVLRRERRFSQVNVIEHIKDGERYLEYVRDNYSNNYTEDDVDKTLRSMDQWARSMNDHKIPESLHTRVLVKIGVMGITDLLTYVKNPTRVEWLTNIYNNMQELDDMIDPMGTAFISMDQANMILNSLYEEIQ